MTSMIFEPTDDDGKPIIVRGKPEDLARIKVINQNGDLLDKIFARQLQLQIDSYGADPSTFDVTAKCAYLQNMVAAIHDECSEINTEHKWKSWSHADPYFNGEAIIGEAVDLLHFVINVFLVAGVKDAAEIERRYQAKASINAARQERSYDETSAGEKCKLCKRALDDTAVKCKAPGPPYGRGYCDIKKAYWG
jgi:dimeric dUTPase (all-alpha-NTP-PPase superfamily)